MSVGIVRSQHGIVTRNLDQANQAQNSTVERPAMLGPSPQSHWAHMPGSGNHGRNTRRCPRRWLSFTSATARRTVRSEPSNPRPVSLSKATSARTFPFDRSTHSSIFGMNGSISRSRRGGSTPSGNRPRSRRST